MTALLPYPNLVKSDIDSVVNWINYVTGTRLNDIAAFNGLTGGSSATSVSVNSTTGPWIAYAPVWSSDGGAFGGISSSGRYLQMGKTVFYEVSGAITSVGGASNTAYFTLPAGVSASNMIAIGKDAGLTGKSLTAQIGSGGAVGAVQFYDGSSAIAKNADLIVSGIYETA